MTRKSAAAACLLAVATIGNLAHGEESTGAVALFREGVSALRAEELPEAASLFRLSYRMDPRASTQCNLALAFEGMEGHEREAIAAYRQCAADDQEGRFRPRAVARARAMEQELELRAPEAASAVPNGPPADAGGDLGGEPPGVAGSVDAEPTAAAAGEGPRPVPHPLLWTGAAAGAVALATLGTAIGLAAWGSAESSRLQRRYPDGNIPAESEDARALEAAIRGTDAALGLYITTGLLGAICAVLVAVDLVVVGTAFEATALALTPTRGGATAAITLRFR